ncbi:MAG: hypothetical protein IIT76_02530 [Prevotella sp.]|jgi:hypothetical protein|nr:hypothetical protein [Prevotella sp.]
MKAMTKSELACEAGVSVKTLKNWCRPFSEDLARMGVNPKAKKLPPYAVAYLSEKLCLDL